MTVSLAQFPETAEPADMRLAKTRLAKVERWNLGLSAGAVAASYALATPHFAISLALGAVLEAVNLGAIHRAARTLFAGQMMSGGWVGGLAIRFLLLGTCIYLTLTAGADPIAFVVGLSIAMPATVIDAWINRPPVVDPATLPVFLDDAIDRDEDERLFQTGRLFTSPYSDRPDDRPEDLFFDEDGNPIPEPSEEERTR